LFSAPPKMENTVDEVEKMIKILMTMPNSLTVLMASVFLKLRNGSNRK